MDALRNETSKVIVGPNLHDRSIDTGLLTKGHILLEGLPD